MNALTKKDYKYFGLLDKDMKVISYESYSQNGGGWSLSFAKLDLNNDNKFDICVSFKKCESKNLIYMIFPSNSMQDYNKKVIRNSNKNKRPEGVKKPIELLKISKNAIKVPLNSSSVLLDKIKSGQNNDKWYAAVSLWKKTKDKATLTKIYELLLSEKNPSIYSFALCGGGEDGVILLGKALKNTKGCIAQKCALYLFFVGDDAKYALKDLIGSLNKDYKNTRHNIFSSILNVAKSNYKLLFPYRNNIEKYSTDDNPDIRQYVKDILKTLEKYRGRREKN